MKITGLLIFLLLAMWTGISCKKEPTKTFCWQLLDLLGNPLNTVCGKTEAEMQVSYPNPCTYYIVGDNYCWLLDSLFFIPDKPQDFIDRYHHCFNYTSAIKVSCDYCQKWYTRQKYLYKPD